MKDLAKVKRLSKLLAHMCSVSIIIMPLWVIWLWSDYEQHLGFVTSNRISLVLWHSSGFSTLQIFAASSFHMMTVLVLVYGVWHIRKLFLLFHQAVFFSNESAHHLQAFGQALLISALLKPVGSVFYSYLISKDDPPGEKVMLIEFGASEISLIFIACTFMVITWILREGHRLSTENATFV